MSPANRQTHQTKRKPTTNQPNEIAQTRIEEVATMTKTHHRRVQKSSNKRLGKCRRVAEAKEEKIRIIYSKVCSIKSDSRQMENVKHAQNQSA
jgi:hypothetical protein